MTIKNVCFIIALAFLFYLFVKSPHIGDGCLIGAYLIYGVATVIYIIANSSIQLGAIKDRYLRKIMRRGLEILCIRRGKILLAASLMLGVLFIVKNVPSHVMLNGNGYKLLDFDLVSASRFAFVICLFSSPILIAYDFYLLSYVRRRLSAQFGQEKAEEPFEFGPKRHCEEEV